jgi:hypothetical protein
MFQTDYNARDGAKFEMESVISSSIMAKNKTSHIFNDDIFVPFYMLIILWWQPKRMC